MQASNKAPKQTIKQVMLVSNNHTNNQINYQPIKQHNQHPIKTPNKQSTIQPTEESIKPQNNKHSIMHAITHADQTINP